MTRRMLVLLTCGGIAAIAGSALAGDVETRQPVVFFSENFEEANLAGQGWLDDRLAVERTDVILRSTDFPKTQFSQFLMAPYFGPGLLPHPQALWIEELAVGKIRIALPPATASLEETDQAR